MTPSKVILLRRAEMHHSRQIAAVDWDICSHSALNTFFLLKLSLCGSAYFYVDGFPKLVRLYGLDARYP